jgi:hypothetical protein
MLVVIGTDSTDSCKCTVVSSTNKTVLEAITEILFKVALNTITLTVIPEKKV